MRHLLLCIIRVILHTKYDTLIDLKENQKGKINQNGVKIYFDTKNVFLSKHKVPSQTFDTQAFDAVITLNNWWHHNSSASIAWNLRICRS